MTDHPFKSPGADDDYQIKVGSIEEWGDRLKVAVDDWTTKYFTALTLAELNIPSVAGSVLRHARGIPVEVKGLDNAYTITDSNTEGTLLRELCSSFEVIRWRNMRIVFLTADMLPDDVQINYPQGVFIDLLAEDKRTIKIKNHIRIHHPFVPNEATWYQPELSNLIVEG